MSFSNFEAWEVDKGKCSIDEYLLYCCGILGLTMFASILQNCLWNLAEWIISENGGQQWKILEKIFMAVEDIYMILMVTVLGIVFLQRLQ